MPRRKTGQADLLKRSIDLLFLGGGQAASQRPIHSQTGIGNTAAPLTIPP
ncbi:MAG TPA: hypothetical protein VMR20_15285 [Verrucomicrobiae bacterium]|nr:hypothetical protein [Verrucomicrobiae bacterium]